MKLFETNQVREIDEYTIRNEPIASADLMERAAMGCVNWIEKNIARGTSVALFVGPGNNGGDGWAIARLLAERDYSSIQVFHLQISHIISPDSEINRNRLIIQAKVPVYEIRSIADFPQTDQNIVIIDALFGSGLSRPLDGLPAALVNFINHSGCRVLSIDIPSGLLGEDNSGNPEQGIIRASVTLTFQFPKRSFFYAENEKYVGRWHIIPIGLHPEIMAGKQTDLYYTAFEDISDKLIKRKRFSHKGTYGHALLIAGSYGMMGAAILAARACIRSGVGLLTTHIPREGYSIIQGVVPESIFSIDNSNLLFTTCPSTDKFSAVGVGPGIGVDPKTELSLESLFNFPFKPMVIDADALNLLALYPHLLNLLPEQSIITPHPGEFDRLAGKSDTGFKRNQLQIEFSKKFKVIIVLKGACTSISLPDGSCYFNSTGNPGMATAGCGDVLTGIILSLLAQGYSNNDAAIMGTFIHGLAGDLAADKTGQHALIASDIIDFIGTAIKKIENYETSA